MVKNITNTKEILWQNVQALMLYKYGKENLWQFCIFVEVGAGTGTRIKQMETSVGFDVLEKIANKFDLQVWQLLVPNLDVTNPPMLQSETAKQREFYEKMKKAAQEIAKYQ